MASTLNILLTENSDWIDNKVIDLSIITTSTQHHQCSDQYHTQFFHAILTNNLELQALTVLLKS